MISGLSYNQPRLCADAIWTSNATTILTNVTLGGAPFSLFIDGINTIYVTSQTRGFVWIRPQDPTVQPRNITNNFNRSSSVFVNINGDVYIDNGFVNGRVDRWIFNSSNIESTLAVNGSCFGLFIDLNDLVYCSLRDLHQVVRLISTVVAGTGTAGFSSTMLNQPQGIYVDSSSNLFVADCGNNRVQMFASLQSTGVTVVGNGSSSPSMSLNCPTSVILDQQGYVFVVDSNNHRVIGSSANGFRCIVGCPGGSSGSAAWQLSSPQMLAFDSYGNLYVTDPNNNRVQRFDRQPTACCELINND